MQKTYDFSKFMVFPNRQGELCKCRHFVDKGEEGQIFSDFLQTSFMDGTLAFSTVAIISSVSFLQDATCTGNRVLRKKGSRT